jgi:hypothetical protein
MFGVGWERTGHCISYITYLLKCKTAVIQDDPPENASAKGKCIYPYLRQTPKIKYLLRKIFYY